MTETTKEQIAEIATEVADRNLRIVSFVSPKHSSPIFNKVVMPADFQMFSKYAIKMPGLSFEYLDKKCTIKAKVERGNSQLLKKFLETKELQNKFEQYAIGCSKKRVAIKKYQGEHPEWNEVLRSAPGKVIKNRV